MFEDRFTQGQTVTFRLKDAVCPRFGDALQAIGPDLEVRGEIVFFSDGGERRNHYAIVEVGGLHTPLIVPVERLEAIAGCAAATESWRSAEEPPSAEGFSLPEPSRQVG